MLTWTTGGVDVVCLQETWLHRPSHARAPVTAAQAELWLQQATESLNVPAYACYWAHNAGDAAGNNGVGILIRQSAHALRVLAHQPSACGRLQLLEVEWAGHTFHLANSYWPADGPAQRASFLAGTLTPALPAAANVIVLGDFNFTTDPARDRAFPAESTATADRSTAALLAAALPHHHDAHRLHHPTGRAFTFHRGVQLARLDRILLPDALVRHCHSTSIVYSPRGDHHAATCRLLPAIPPQPRGPGRRPIPCSLPSDPDTHSSLAAWAGRAVAFGLTLDDAALLHWWPTAQRAYARHARSLQAAAAHQRAALAAEVTRAQGRLDAAMQTVERAPVANLSTAIAATTTARAALAEAARAATRAGTARSSANWLHAGERPCPLITTLIRPPTTASTIPALAAPNGSLLTDNRAIADRLTTHYAAVSRRIAVDSAAQAAVLAAIRADINSGRLADIPAQLAALAGAAAISEAEVRSALRSTPPTSAPGLDGIPYSLWRVNDDCWAPLLARLFSAIGALGLTPAGFTDGTVTAIPKPAAPDATACASYRPITLLPSLYRVLGKILATRFGIAMNPAIGTEQSAFLPDRRIEDNINFTSLLPLVLTSRGASGATVFLDISKAFDTVDRAFLYDLMAAMGASAGMVNWARILLYHTVASTSANGVESTRRTWEAGVRQGCPLSPLLYLFVAQGLASWLHAQPNLGVQVDGRRYVSTHHADDTQVHLGNLSPDALRTLSVALDQFTAASGQSINLDKSTALLIGVLPPDYHPTSLAGIPVVHHALSLGIPQHNPPPVAVHPADRRHTRAAMRPPQPEGPPPPTPAHVLAAWGARIAVLNSRLTRVARLPLSTMGRGLSTSAYALSTFLYHAEFAGFPPDLDTILQRARTTIANDIPLPLLCGSPGSGGFGLLPLQQHIHARHAAMALRLIQAWTPQRPAPAPVAAPLDLGDGMTGLLSRQRPAPWTDLAASLFKHACPSLSPVQSLLAATLSSAHEATAGVLGVAGVPQPTAIPDGPLRHMLVALQALGPPTILHGNRSLTPAALLALRPTAIGEVDPDALAPLHWLPASGLLVPLLSMDGPSVRDLTSVLVAPWDTLRHQRHDTFVRAALGVSSRVSVARPLAAFRSSLRKAWRIRCPNALKEPFWRLAIDATPGARVQPWRCPCSTDVPYPHGRPHSFWDCPVAVAVRRTLEATLPDTTLHRSALWLMRPPVPACSAPVWRLVCLAAVDAMEHGRRLLWATRHRTTAAPCPLPDDVLTVVGAAAVTRFWSSLRDFAAHAPVLPAFRVRHDHPFLAFVDEALVVVPAPAPVPVPGPRAM